MLPKAIFTDVDGVLTDGGMYYNFTGKYLKKFNTTDIFALHFCKFLNIPVYVISGESDITEKRINDLKHLGITDAYLNIKDKLNVAMDICIKLNIQLKDCAFIGDDLNDYQLLKVVGISATPSNVSKYIRKITNLKLKSKRGNSCFREFIEKIIAKNMNFNRFLKEYMSNTY